MLFPALLMVGVTAAPELAAPQAISDGITGMWTGGGTVIYASGERERARCTAHYSGSASVVSLSANCATPSGSISQSTTLRRTGPNTYSGDFFNQQYNISGTIHVVVQGTTQKVSLKSGNMSGSLTLEYQARNAPRSTSLFSDWQ
ncbi:MAG TPA: hypothetical protein VE986_09175 [Hyphomicrobiales bacterium]|nr:hypothetical protein [Hyphomicrobiales bacterium]